MHFNLPNSLDRDSGAELIQSTRPAVDFRQSFVLCDIITRNVSLIFILGGHILQPKNYFNSMSQCSIYQLNICFIYLVKNSFSTLTDMLRVAVSRSESVESLFTDLSSLTVNIFKSAT